MSRILYPLFVALFVSQFVSFFLAGTTFAAAAGGGSFTMGQVLDYPFADRLVAAGRGDRVAWVRNVDGVRNIWMAAGPAFRPRQFTQYTEDDGQELTSLVFSPDGSRFVYVRGGDHDENWPAEGNLAPDPASSPGEPVVTIWSVPARGGRPVKIAEGDMPAISSKGVLAYIKDDQVWTAPLDGKGKPERFFFDRGKDSDLQWSPDGTRLAFVSDRGDHSFIGVFANKTAPLEYLAPSTSKDISPRWSPDGAQIAFVRTEGDGGSPEPILKWTPHPWSIRVADSANGTGRLAWQSPDTLSGSLPDVAGGANLSWAAGNRLVFLAWLDGWDHLYSVPSSGGPPLLLTPGAYMVEHVSESRDRRFMIFDANTGTTKDDDDRRHIFRVAVDRAGPMELTAGTGIEWTPVAASAGRVAFVSADAKSPPSVGIVGMDGTQRVPLAAGTTPKDFPEDALSVPKSVSFKSSDGLTVHGQLFANGDAAAGRAKPGLVFVHGGPSRQMLLGWHYMDYYSNAYAVNQYLAAHGFVVLSVNYRLGIGYGRAFHQPDRAGPTGAAEYRDVLAAARYLRALPGVDAKRIGIWGGSYGGYLTALALARNSNIFKAGVDLHGVHDWTSLPDFAFAKPVTRFERGDRDEALKAAWTSSPDSSIGTWISPVLLIQGDDDRNVPFHQTVDLARRLEDRHIPFDELVIPNEIHGFLRHEGWLRADTATVAFFEKQFGVPVN